MGKEASKNHVRRLKWGDYERFFKGKGIDIGCGSDPVLPDCDTWDKVNGDATHMATVPDQQYDWVHSSHCLEHIKEFETALYNWWRILKLGGHLIITVPDYNLYEHANFPPSRYNGDHKIAFSMNPSCIEKDPIIKTYNDIARKLIGAQFVRAQLNDSGFDYTDYVSDQTAKRNGEAQAELEFIFRKSGDPIWTGYR